METNQVQNSYNNLRIHFGGTWTPSAIGTPVTMDDYVGEFYTDIPAVGDFVNMFGVEIQFKRREWALREYDWDFFQLKNRVVRPIDSEAVVMDLWFNDSNGKDELIHIYAEPKMDTMGNCSQELVDLSYYPSQPENLESQSHGYLCPSQLYETQNTNPTSSAKMKGEKGKKTKELPVGVEILPLPDDVDEDIPEEILDECPIFNPPTGFTPPPPTFNDFLNPSPTFNEEFIIPLFRNIDINSVEPEEHFIPSDEPESDFEEYEGNYTNQHVDDLYSDGELGEEKPIRNEVGVLEKSMLWATLKEAREYLRTYAIQNKFVIHFWKNEKRRVWGICRSPGCPWMCRFYKKSDGFTTKLSKLNKKHTCRHTSNLKNRMADARWISVEFEEQIKTHIDSWTTKDIVSAVWKRYGVEISYNNAWKAKIKVLEHLFGTYEDAYRLGPEICRQVILTNPGSVATCTTDNTDSSFYASFISFKGSLDGFRQGCRPLIGLDGCFLKGKYGGVCLSATALDGNNGLFPLAIFICKNEGRPTWTKFLEQLKPHVLLHPERISFISDRQKGLLEAVNELFPGHNHRFCFRHMYKNFKKTHPGEHLRVLSWGAARSYMVEDNAKWLAQIEKDAPEAHEWLLREDVSSWCRSYFDRTSKCEHITNNFSESFNNWIGDLRDKPLTAFIDMFQVKVMKLMLERRVISKKLVADGLVPRAERAIAHLCTQMNRWRVHPSDDRLFLVISTFNHEQRFIVDIVQKTCDCCVWDVTGMPCVHVVCVLEPMHANWVKYCSSYHSVKTYQATYAHRVAPIPDRRTWQAPQYMVLPPVLQRKPGRPPTIRRREEDEAVRPPKKKRRCSICKCLGHNKKKCAGGAVGSNKRNPKPSTTTRAPTDGGTTQTTIQSQKKRNARYSGGQAAAAIHQRESLKNSGPTVGGYERASVGGYERAAVGAHVHLKPPNPDLYMQVQRPNAFSQPPPMKPPSMPPSQTFKIQVVRGSSRNVMRGGSSKNKTPFGGSSSSSNNNNFGGFQFGKSNNHQFGSTSNKSNNHQFGH